MDSESQTQNQNHFNQFNHHHRQPPPTSAPPGIPASFQNHQFQNANPISGFGFNSAAPQNPNSSTKGSGFALNSSAAAPVAQNPNSSTGFSLNSSAAASVPQNQNSSTSLSGFGVNSSAAAAAAAAAASVPQNQNSSASLSGFGMDSSGPGNSGAAPVAVSVAVEGTGAAPASTDQGKKKRGRPRKYSPEGGNTSSAPNAAGGNAGDLSGGGDPNGKRSRGRPLGSGRKQMDALGGNGVGFTPHMISVRAGEDISYKIMSFAQQGPRTVCILSATGSICNVTLRQAATSGGNVTYEGRYEIVSLSGSFHPLENGSRAGALSVSLVGTDGNVVGGSVAGMLVAASPIQVIVGSFVSEMKKQKAKLPSAAPSPNILNFSAPASGVASSPSQGASSESSEENHDTPVNHGQGPYTNAGQPMQNMSMYSPVNWTNPIKMPPN